MNRISQFISNFGRSLSEYNTQENWLQVAVVLTALLAAWLLTKTLGRILRHARHGQHSRMRPLLPRQLQYISFPFFALLLTLLSYVAFKVANEPQQILYIAAVLLTAFLAVRLLSYWLRRNFAVTPALKSWERLIAIVVYLTVLSYLTDVLPALIELLDSIAVTVGNTRVSALSVLNLIILVGVLFTLAIWVSTFIERRLKSHMQLSSGVRVGISKVVRYFLITVAVLVALEAVGIDLTALTVFGGALGVGIGFGLQRIASNFISGFLLLFDRSIQPGDIVRIGDRVGQVQELHARYLVVRDYDGVSTLIPNENLITSEVINWSYGDTKIRLKVPVEISYQNDPEHALNLMLDIARAHPRVLNDPAASALLVEFGASGIKLEVNFWIDDPQNGMASLRSEINIAIWRAFQANKIQIPYPQQDVYIKEVPPQWQSKPGE